MDRSLNVVTRARSEIPKVSDERYSTDEEYGQYGNKFD